ncbi:mycothiol synthase [Salinibacterium sp. CAN_S4]|uniref:mycothiol synthase n=1 Tax=Salinibacterium sp. CAN_S4 TaxID=2787727 RepID=UPI0018F01827
MSDPLSPTRSSLQSLVGRARAADGSPPFSDGALVELAQGTANLQWLDGAAAIVTAESVEFVVDPDARRRGLGTRMLEHLTTAAPGQLLFWSHGDHPGARALAASHALEPVRELLHLEAVVPAECSGSVAETATRVAETEHSRADGAAIAPIRLPEEAQAWLGLNARAFAGHPEQGRVTRADLDTTMAESWFDADDFLVLRDGPSMIGFCWLKVDGGEGEFYVVGVDPDRQGERLGRRLVEAGLARLAGRGIRMAHLYVEGDNAPALKLYRGFGFTNRSVDIQYRWVPQA